MWRLHGSPDVSGLYLRETLEEMQRRHACFHCVPCMSRRQAHGLMHHVALERLAVLDGWIVGRCSNPAVVEAGRDTGRVA